MLHGRAAETAMIDGLLGDARAGRSAALVVRGEAGIGKSALLSYAADAATDAAVLRGTGIEAESDLPYAGLHLLLAPHLDRVAALPEAQARALNGALGTGEASNADRFLVGMAVLSLLAELAEDGPLLCSVDDAHWLDQASAETLLFVARRLNAEGVVLLLAARDLHAPEFPAPGLPELRLGRLNDADAAALLAERAADLPAHARDQIRHQAEGNPLALLELPAAQREGHLAASPYAPGGMTAHSRIQRTFADRIGALPEATRTLLVVAAAEGTGDTGVVLRAAERFGPALTDLAPAEGKGLLRLADGRLEFRHPLVRAAAYQAVPSPMRLAVHRALADALEAESDVDRRAWHLAAAATGPDEEAADALERTAEHARKRGGYAAVAAAYERAAALTPATAERGRRLTAAARAAADAGLLDRAAALADDAARLLTAPEALAEVAAIQATLAGGQGDPRAAHRILAGAALSVTGVAPFRASRMLFGAVEAAWDAADLARVAATAELATELGLENADRVRAMARVAAGLDHRSGGDVADALRALRELLAVVESRTTPLGLDERATITLWWLLLGEDSVAHDLASALVRDARTAGAIGMLPRALAFLARTQLVGGQFREARTTAAEGLRIAADIGQPSGRALPSGVLALLAAIEDAPDRLDELSTETGTTGGAIWLACARSLLDLGHGRYEAVLDRLNDLASGPYRVDMLSSLPDVIEAAARLDRPEQAREILRWYTDWAAATGQAWAEAVALRCAALTADGPEEAIELFARSVELHRKDDRRPFDRARTELLLGERLRRERRKTEARAPLRSALETFERLGARVWADRARNELRATGESRSGGGERGPDLADRLTPQELQIARLAATGLTNREIAAELFLSPRTVGYHLSNAYPKLGITTRGALAALDLG
jgi:DNA-binding CsgD family transcriptional regulator